MVAIRLEEDGLAYITAKLHEAGTGIASAIQPGALRDPIVFVPDFADPLTLPDLETGGVASQEGANAEFAAYLLFLQRRDPKLTSVIFADPWASMSDLDYVGAPPPELVTMAGTLNYVYALSSLTPQIIWDYRSWVVSYLKFAFVSSLSLKDIQSVADEEPEDLFARLAKSIRHIAVSAYDDESWLIARYERS